MGLGDGRGQHWIQGDDLMNSIDGTESGAALNSAARHVTTCWSKEHLRCHVSGYRFSATHCSHHAGTQQNVMVTSQSFDFNLDTDTARNRKRPAETTHPVPVKPCDPVSEYFF
jgi:hypothetical protein